MSEEKVAAAFFDLDNTCIRGATLLILAKTLHDNGLIPYAILVRSGIAAAIYDHFGANEDQTNKMKDDVLEIVDGWIHEEVSAIVHSVLHDLIEPRIYHEARKLIQYHIDQGHSVFIVSRSPIELVGPIAEMLGVGIDNVIATRIHVDEDGKCTAAFDLYVDADVKREEMLRIAEERNIDLAASFAYSDSHTDLPLLSTVGHPFAVNPDKKLALHSKANGWDEPLHFERPDPKNVNLPITALHNPWVKAGAGVAVASAAGAAGLALSRRLSFTGSNQ